MIGGIYLDMLDLAWLKTVLWFHVAAAALSLFSLLFGCCCWVGLMLIVLLLVDVIEFRLKSTADRFNSTLQ